MKNPVSFLSSIVTQFVNLDKKTRELVDVQELITIQLEILDDHLDELNKAEIKILLGRLLNCTESSTNLVVEIRSDFNDIILR